MLPDSAPAARPGRGLLLPLFVALAGSAVLPAASLLTYRAWIDGPLGPFCLALGAGILAAALVAYWWTNAFRPPGPVLLGLLGLPLAVLASLPAPAVHGARLLGARAEVGSALGLPVEYGRALTPVLQGEGTFGVDPGGLDLRAPSGSTAYVELRWPSDPAREWRLPRALVTPDSSRRREEVVWRAGVQVDNRYFVLAEAGRLNVQLVDWGGAGGLGLLVTAPDERGVAKGESVPLTISRGQEVEWALRREDGRVRLLSDGQEVWSGADAGTLAPTRIGETRTDGEHGGRLRLAGVRFRRWTS
jgi:hypothetical protein